MAVSANCPGKLGLCLANKELDWVADTVKCALVTSLAAYDQDTTQYWTTLASAEVAEANGYTPTGGLTVGTKSAAYDASSNRARFKGVVAAWTSSGAGFSAVGAVVYGDTGDAATSPIISVINFGGTETASNGGTFTITMDSTDGVFYIQAAA